MPVLLSNVVKKELPLLQDFQENKCAQLSSLNLSNKLIHPSIQKDALLFTRAKTLLVLLIFFLLILIGYTSFFIFNGVFFNVKAILNYLGVLVTISSMIMLKVSNNLKYPLRTFGYFGILLVTGGVYWSGGFASNDILWYSVLAVSSLLFVGKIDGVIISILSILCIIGFYLIDILHLVELPFDPLTRSIHYRFANALIIVFILFFLVWVLVKRNDRLQELIQEIQASQIRESISQDFHDELGNKLASVVHLSKRLKDSKSDLERSEMLKVIETESQQVYDNFRDFIWTNSPDSIMTSSLFMYLTDFNQQFFAHKDLNVEGELLQANFSVDESVSSNVVRHVVPLFKELMTNVYKHAKATRVDWSLTCSDGGMILSVKDNGIGFDPQTVKYGQGLKSINKRVLELKGELNIVSENGTHVLLKIDRKNKGYNNV